MTVGPLPEIDSSKRSPEESKLLRSKRWFYTVAALCGSIVLLVVLGYLLDILAVPVGIVIWTVIIVFCLRGIVNALDNKGLSRGAATAIAYVVMVLVLGAVVLLMCSPILGLGDQFTSLIQGIPGYVNQLTTWWNDIYSQYQDIFANDQIKVWTNEALASIASAAQEMVKESATGVVAFGSGLANAVMIIGFALVVAFWVLMELPQLGAEFKRLMGPRYEQDLDMLHVTLTRILGGYIRATLVQCAIIGLVCAILFLVLGIPNFAALGVITGLLNIIPVIGPWFGGAAAAGIGLMASPIAALIAFIGTIIIQQFVYTFISPRLMADSVDVHPALTLIFLMVGSAAGGAMGGLVGSIFGMLISIPAVAVAKALFVYYFEKQTGRSLVAADGVFFKGVPSEGEGVDPIMDATSPHPNSTAKFAPIDMSKIEVRMPTGKMKAIKDKGHRQKDEEEILQENEARHGHK